MYDALGKTGNCGAPRLAERVHARAELYTPKKVQRGRLGSTSWRMTSGPGEETSHTAKRVQVVDI